MTDDSKKRAHAQIVELIQKFKNNEKEHLQAGYNETQVRTDFIKPLLAILGWDVDNTKQHPPALREVIEESTVKVGEERLSKKPDYELRLARQRKLFVEAKKPSIHIDRDKASAFQTRRYGYSASLPIAVLTNFHQLAIYDCIPTPQNTDEANVARLLLLKYTDFDTRFDELWETLSWEAVHSSLFDQKYLIGTNRHETQQFDNYFLCQVKNWRKRLAVDIHQNNPNLTPTELAFSVQLFLSRIIFLRICEDRNLEKYESLKKLDGDGSFAALKTLLKRADKFYDSGLFQLISDTELGINISDSTLQSIISELYYPQSPYTFSVVETEVLGEIYELFLGEVITVQNGNVEIVEKPEVRKSGGIVPTPRFIVDAIVERTLQPLLSNRGPHELLDFSVADICCGSGVFLLSVFDHLLEHYLTWYLTNNFKEHANKKIYKINGQWQLGYEEKRRILVQHVRGVDIDSNAVEVARFSLLLKLIEHESMGSLQEFVRSNKTPALPSLEATIRCGNSLVSHDEWKNVQGILPDNLIEKINPFSWLYEFPNEFALGGFDAIVGNPPYIRIQDMKNYSREEVSFYQNATSIYTTAEKNNFDKYALFIERSLQLLSSKGRLGVIVPHKFMTIKAGLALRKLIVSRRLLDEIVHFGTQQVFGPKKSNYTCILVLDRAGADKFKFQKVSNIEKWRYDKLESVKEIQANTLTDGAWTFLSPETVLLFNKLRTQHPNKLSEVAEIFVGVQTSNDKVYIIHPVQDNGDMVFFRWNNRDWPIEKSILRLCLHDSEIVAFARPNPNAYIIFPYHVNGKKANLIQPQEFENFYPKCWAYLNARKNELDRRNITGGLATECQWYQYGRSQSLTKFNTPKIILPALSTEPRYAYDDRDILVTGGGNGPYYLIRPRNTSLYSIYYLLAVLCHPLSEAIIRSSTSEFRGGFYSHGKQFIENLPIPFVDEDQKNKIEDLVSKLLIVFGALSSTRIPHQKNLKKREAQHLQDQIEQEVNLIFGLTKADLDIIKQL